MGPRQDLNFNNVINVNNGFLEGLVCANKATVLDIFFKRKIYSLKKIYLLPSII